MHVKITKVEVEVMGGRMEGFAMQVSASGTPDEIDAVLRNALRTATTQRVEPPAPPPMKRRPHK